MVGQDGEMTGLQHVPEVLQCFVECKELTVVGTPFAGLSFLKKETGCQGPCTRCWRIAPMAVVEASVTRASGEDGSGWVRRAACERLALLSLNALVDVLVQVIEWEP